MYVCKYVITITLIFEIIFENRPANFCAPLLKLTITIISFRDHGNGWETIVKES